MQFVAWLHLRGLASGTAKSYLAVVRHTQISLGLGDMNMGQMPQLEYVIRGMKRLARPSGRTRLPITPELLRGMQVAWQSHPNPKDAVMLWAAATICFFGFLRAGEVVIPGDHELDPAIHLAHGDVTVDNVQDPKFIVVVVKASKTDPYRKGVRVYLGRVPGELCPVAVLSYMVSRGSQPGPFFKFYDGRSLTRKRFVAAVREALAAAGYVGAHYYIQTPQEVLCGVARNLVSPIQSRA